MMTFVLQDGWSPLYIASFNGHLDVVKTLMEAGANINQANKVRVLVSRYTCVNVHAMHVHYCAYCMYDIIAFIKQNYRYKYMLLHVQLYMDM